MSINEHLIRTIQKSGLYLKKSASTLLAIAGSFGVVATAIASAKATPKAIELIKKAEEKKDEGELTKVEKVRIVTPTYISTAIIGVGTIICIFGSDALNKRKQAAILSAYALIEQSYSRYKRAANKVFGDDADEKIGVESAKQVYIHDAVNGKVVTYDPESHMEETELFYDEFGARYFTSSMTAVLNAEYHINRNFVLKGFVTLNDFYDFLGIDRLAGGDEIGWDSVIMMETDLMWVDFENVKVKMDDGLEAIIVSPVFNPTKLCE